MARFRCRHDGTSPRPRSAKQNPRRSARCRAAQSAAGEFGPAEHPTDGGGDDNIQQSPDRRWKLEHGRTSGEFVHRRHCERSDAIHGAARRYGLLRRFAPRNDGVRACTTRPPISLTGKSLKTCLAPFAKIFLFCSDPNHLYIHHRLVPLEGRFAVVTNAGRDAVDAAALLTNGA